MTKRFGIIIGSLLFVIVCLFLYDSFSQEPPKRDERYYQRAPESMRNAPYGMVFSPGRDKFSVHQYAYAFLNSDFKDSVEGQAMALTLITNGCSIEFIPALMYASERMKGIKRAERRTSDPEEKKSIQDAKCSTKYVLIRGGFPNSDPSLLDKLLSFCPRRSYKLPFPEVSRDTPDEKLLKESDVLDYIREHPAKSHWFW